MKQLGNIILPVFNEEDSIQELSRLIELEIKNLNYNFVITYIDDGSIDRTWEIIKNLKIENAKIRKIKLSRNFGHQAAIFAGIDAFNEDFAIIMDSDFQDNPKYIKFFIEKWEEGFKLVLAKKTERKGEHFKRILTKIYFAIQNKLTPFNIPKNVGHFSLIDSSAINSMRKFTEVNKFLIGIRAFVGSKIAYVEVVKEKRKYGNSKVSLSRLFNLSLDGIFSFSTVPLNILVFFSIFTFLVILMVMTFYYFQNIFGTRAHNLSFIELSLIIINLINLLNFAVIGQYISKIFYEVKDRPTYLIEEVIEI